MNSVTGAVFATRRNIFEQLNGFDPVYGKGTYEDVDYCFKVRSTGKKVVYTPEAVAYHKVGGSIVDGANRESFNLTVNEQIFRGRWLPYTAWDEWIYY
jgi:GT2 family glycosyltransferase